MSRRQRQHLLNAADDVRRRHGHARQLVTCNSSLIAGARTTVGGVMHAHAARLFVVGQRASLAVVVGECVRGHVHLLRSARPRRVSRRRVQHRAADRVANESVQRVLNAPTSGAGTVRGEQLQDTIHSS